jgi:glycosyltransferase involved in cell wall biosynthesis
MRNGIVIPCYNESKRLKLDEFQDFIDSNLDYALCFVNDGSSDNTLKVLLDFQLGQEDRIHVLNMEENQGKAEAVRQGVNKIMDISGTENVGFIDADLSTGFEDVKRLVENLDSSEDNQYMVFGSRKMDNGENIERSKFRDLASNIVGFSIKQIIGLPISDTQCGAKIFKKSLAQKLFTDQFLTRWLFDVEIFIRMKNIYGKTTMTHAKELPLKAWRDVDGSKLSIVDSIKIPVMLSKIAYTYSALKRA